MKLFKRVLAMAVSAALLCPITAYAAPEDDTIAILRQVLEQQQAATDLNAFYDFDITVSGSALETETMTVRLEMNTKMNGMNDPANMKMMSYMRVTDAAGTEVTPARCTTWTAIPTWICWDRSREPRCPWIR